ncbi:MAG TPA: hypothetical protein VJ952_08970, partial [Opitutales bacterium]|nr:hypothetical protein [Opitutales bacterium]
MKVLAVSESFLPGRDGGGPVRALHNLSAHLPEECQLSILTRNRDYLHPETYPDLPSDQWIEGEHSGICYASDSRWWAIYRNSIREWKPDWIYLNGLFAPMSRKILGNRSGLEKFVLAPHGNLGPAALNKGKFKKKIWLWQACRRGYFNQVRWHAASEREAAQIRRNVDQNAEILTVPMAPASMQEPWGPDDVEEMKSKDGLRLVYFGRLSSEKNLDFALQCLRDFAREQPGIRVNYDIYYIGPRAPHLEARAREIG